MRLWFSLVLAVAIFSAAPARGLGQGLGASVHVGTLGLGARLGVPIAAQVNLRGGLDLQPISLESTYSDVTYDLNLPSPSFTAVLDLHPGRSGFRLSGGAIYFTTDLELKGSPTVPVDIGSREYNPAELGSLTGSLGTSEVAPYLGLGWGNSTGGRLAFSFDLGVAFHGTPDVQLRATGPIGNDPQFVSDLEQEIEEINDEIPGGASVYPILNLGLSFGL